MHGDEILYRSLNTTNKVIYWLKHSSDKFTFNNSKAINTSDEQYYLVKWQKTFWEPLSQLTRPIHAKTNKT
jgi:DNA-binding helix-hairpin-helix protein with protein kinase domain